MGCSSSKNTSETANPSAETPTAEVCISLETPLVSSFNDAYYATVSKVVLTEAGAAVHFAVVGDDSLGSLQVGGTLSCGDVPCSGEPTAELTVDEPLSKAGVLNFALSKEQPWGDLVFSYGTSGYSSVTLASLTEEFATENNLAQFSWAQ